MQTHVPIQNPAAAPDPMAAPAPMAPPTSPQITEQRLMQTQDALGALKAEIEKCLFGQSALVLQAIIGLLARGNVLIEGQPGLGKTLLVKVMSEALQLQFSRIQFTPDLMPADITGSQTLAHDEQGKAKLEFRRGPVVIDSATTPPPLLKQITALPAGEVFIFPNQGMMTANTIIETKVEPLGGEQATALATNRIMQERMAASAKAKLDKKVEEIRASVKYQEGYAPPKSAGAKAAPAG